MDDVGMVLVDWNDDVDDLFRRADAPARWLCFTNVHLLTPPADHCRGSGSPSQGGAVVIPFASERIEHTPSRSS